MELGKDISELVRDGQANVRRVLQQAQSQIADLAIEAASKIVGANLDDEKNRRLVDEFLSEEEGDK